jgi:alpha-glucosidase
MKKTALLSSLCLLAAFCTASPVISVRSPQGVVQIDFRLDAHGTPQWRVERGRIVMLDWSPLGLTLLHGRPFAAGFRITDSIRTEHDETYTLVIGKTKRARDAYRALTVSLRETMEPRRVLSLAFRAYDDGAAFRYALPEQDSLSTFDIVRENTEFHFPGDLKAWAFQINTFRSSYEGQYLPTSLDAIPDTGLVYLPLTLERPDGLTMAITEAELTDYAGMYLRGLPGPALQVLLPPYPDGSGACVHARTPFLSPWRVFMIGKKPGDLIESTIILNLSAPCALDDVSWIHPGKAIFPWWPNFHSGVQGVPDTLDFENQKFYVDFAAENNLQYLELEPPWYGNTDDCIEHPERHDITQPVPGLRLPELFEHARAKHIGIFLWTHWQNVDRQWEQAFPLYVRWGAAGIKVDFMNRDDQEMVRWYHATLKKAAASHLMVFYHGAYKPTGTQRTYPHLLTQEGVMGNEQNKVIRLITPAHTVTIPFTRMLAGPMDFTPGGFRNATAAEFTPNYDRPMVMGTRCHQLAMFVVYESPLSMVCDDPSAYRGEPGLEFIRKVPTSWDATRVLDGKIGEHVAIARQSGTDWYLGAMTDWSDRTVRLPLAFLGSGTFDAEIYADGADADDHPTHLTVTHRLVTSRTVLTPRLARGGGAAIVFRKQ